MQVKKPMTPQSHGPSSLCISEDGGSSPPPSTFGEVILGWSKRKRHRSFGQSQWHCGEIGSISTISLHRLFAQAPKMEVQLLHRGLAVQFHSDGLISECSSKPALEGAGVVAVGTYHRASYSEARVMAWNWLKRLQSLERIILYSLKTVTMRYSSDGLNRI